MNMEEQLEKVIKGLYKRRNFDSDNPNDLTRATDDEMYQKKLYLNTGSDEVKEDINAYLYHRNNTEMLFYNEISEKIYRMGHLNPHNKPDPYDKYFVDNIEKRKLRHLQELYNLLEMDTTSGVLQLKEYRNVLHIGDKGSGKTLSQNVWLYRNNEKLENNDIVWIRLDALKLMDIWKGADLEKSTLVTPEIYLLGQLVYVFSKHFQKKFPNYYSELFDRIASKLNDSPQNKLSYYQERNTVELTRAVRELFDINMMQVFSSANKKGLETIIDYLKYFEETISQAENTYKDSGETRLDSDRKTNRSRSYLIENVLKESQKNIIKNYKEWITIAILLREFILHNDYYILYIIDGLDHINFYHPNREKYMQKILHLLYFFPLSQSEDESAVDRNELLLMSMRPDTYDALKKIYNKEFYHGFNHYKNVENFYPIYQQTNNLFKPIFNRRIEFFVSSCTYKECFMAKVLERIKESPDIVEEEKEGEKWHSNIRCFLYNCVNLAKYITFKYYFAGKPDKFDIDKQIVTYKNTNLLLNGYLYLCEEKNPCDSDAGNNFFNLFGFTKRKGKPLYFIYTHILLLIKKHEQITYEDIKDIIDCFEDITLVEYELCVCRLVSFGLITEEYSDAENRMKFKITIKGSLALQNFYNDIHFLYYTSLDTKIPKKLLEKFLITPNNYDIEEEKRNYPPYCIITGMYFLRYLYRQNNKIIENAKLKLEKLELLGIKDISIFNLPIKEEELSKSIGEMLRIVYRNNEYKIIFEEWLSKWI